MTNDHHATYAHSLSDAPPPEWEALRVHAASVAQAAGERAAAFGWGPAGQALGALHDIGKASRDFQAYLRGSAAPARVDHSTAGAREAQARYGPQMGRLLAYTLAGHHAGLPDAEDLRRRLDPARTDLPDYAGWVDLTRADNKRQSLDQSKDHKAFLP